MHASSWSLRRASMAALLIASCTPGEGTGPAGGKGGAGGAAPAVTGGRTGDASGGAGGGTGGNPGSGGAAPAAGGQGGGGPGGGTGGAGGGGGPPVTDASGGGEMGPAGKPFSFFVTSIEAMRKQSKSQDGFGGNLGGLSGADGICQAIATEAGAGHKTWRAFLSATKGAPDGGPVHAIDRIGEGPWYDFNGRLIARNKVDLVMVRPAGDPQATADLPNEKGLAQKQFGDNHDTLTGSNQMGRLHNPDPGATCQDWTNASPTGNRPIMCGHSWSRVGRQPWIQEHTVPGCAPGVNLRDNSVMPGNCVGCNGGYGGIYCFALQP